MSDLAIGIILAIFCTAGYFLAWRFAWRDRYSAAIILLVLCGFALRLFVASDFFLHVWDECFHALVAKNMMSDPLTPMLYANPLLNYDYTQWTSNHIWLHKQPMALWLMAGSMKLFGVNEIALRLPSVLLSSVGIWLMYIIGTHFIGRKGGFIAAFLFSINGLIIELSGGRIPTDHIDAQFLFFIMLSVVFAIAFTRQKNHLFLILTGVSLGIAILTKWLPALIVLPVFFLLLRDYKFKISWTILYVGLTAIIAAMVFLPWQYYIHSSFPAEAKWESEYNARHLWETLESQSKPFYYYFNRIRIDYGELAYFPLLWFLWLLWKYPSNYKYFTLAAWFFIPFIFFSFVQTKMQAYILIGAPALFIMVAAFWLHINEYRKGKKWNWFFILILALLIALPIRYTIERTKLFSNRERTKDWVVKLRFMPPLSNAVIFNYPRPIEAMFYTDHIFYATMPDNEVISSLRSQGYSVYINQDNPTANHSNPEGVEYIDLE